MSKASRVFHRVLLSISMSALVWILINKFLVPVSFKEYIIIEISIAFGEIISTFIKEKTGVIEPEKSDNP